MSPVSNSTDGIARAMATGNRPRRHSTDIRILPRIGIDDHLCSEHCHAREPACSRHSLIDIEPMRLRRSTGARILAEQLPASALVKDPDIGQESLA